MSNRKVLAILSGGLDSSTMLWKLQQDGYEVMATISFNYGQRHSKELQGIPALLDAFTEQFGKRPESMIVDISVLRELAASGAVMGDEELPKKAYDVETQKVTIVPNRNAIFISLAAARAVAMGYQYVAYAAHSNDHSVYPDCRPEFVEAMDRTLELANAWTPVNLLAPFVRSSKADIVKIGSETGTPFELTWSCYEGGDRPCLECGTCLERTSSFKEAGFPDPALTTDEWSQALKNLNSGNIMGN